MRAHQDADVLQPRIGCWTRTAWIQSRDELGSSAVPRKSDEQT